METPEVLSVALVRHSERMPLVRKDFLAPTLPCWEGEVTFVGSPTFQAVSYDEEPHQAWFDVLHDCRRYYGYWKAKVEAEARERPV